MRYWHLNNDKLDELKGFHSDGPVWTSQAYYGKDLVSKTWGMFDPSRIRMYFPESDRRKPAPDISMPIGVPICSKQVYGFFLELLKVHVVTFEEFVNDEPWVAFRPVLLVEDSIDMDRSRYHRLASGKPYGFKHIFLNAVPRGNPPIFSFAIPETALGLIIVSDEFKSICESNNLQGVKFLPAFPAYANRSEM